ncbi:MAG: type III-B CRISPR module RAMP protein Cmr1 [Opitutales bacterium]
MKTLTATFRIVTPMFCGGADQQAELRVPSIKGAIRFWWRALMWEKVGGDIKKLHGQESALFGSSQGGQSRVLIRVVQGTKVTPISAGKILKRSGDGFFESSSQYSPPDIVGEGARYLGYGVMEAFGSRKKNKFAGQVTRSCYPCPIEDFTVEFLFRSEEGTKEVDQAIIALGTFGGLGSKSRKGYGSLTITSLKEKVRGESREIDLRIPEEQAKELIKGNSLPGWTAFSKNSRVLILRGDQNESPLELMNRIGSDLVFFRSYGKEGRVFKAPSEKRFTDDHDLMDRVINKSGTPSTHPERIAFGLPQNYFFTSTNGKGGVEPSQHERRASPLFLHIHQRSKDETPLAVISFLPAKFLPDGEEISVGKDRGRKTLVACKTENEFYDPILDWMQSLVTGKRGDHKQTTQSFRNPIAIPSIKA